MKRVAGALYVERRRDPRAEVALRVVYVASGLVIEAKTVDVSIGGMALETQYEMEVGTRLELHFAPQADTATYRLEGDVMWSVQDGEDRYRCGVRFLDLEPNVQAGLRTLVAQYTSEPHYDSIPEIPSSEVVELGENGDGWQIAEAVAVDERGLRERELAAQAAFDEARAAISKGDLGAARSLLEQAIKHRPDFEEAFEELGQVTYLSGDVTRAAALFDRALRLRQERS